MAELANCARCDAVFVKSIRDICPECFKKEEADFDTVYRFLRERKNREATLKEIVAATDVQENIIIKFIKNKRLRTSQFPKLAYPCENCGADILTGKLCHNCSNTFLEELQIHEEKEQQSAKNKEANVYFSLDRHKK